LKIRVSAVQIRLRAPLSLFCQTPNVSFGAFLRYAPFSGATKGIERNVPQAIFDFLPVLP
jgi:hypothetical protein